MSQKMNATLQNIFYLENKGCIIDNKKNRKVDKTDIVFSLLAIV